MPAAPACTARTATCRSLAYEVSARQPEHVGCLRGGEFGVDWDEVNRCSGGEVFEQPTHRSIHSWRKIADNRSQFGVPRIERRNCTAFVVVRIEVLGSERGHATITLDNRHKRNLPAWKPAPASAQPQPASVSRLGSAPARLPDLRRRRCRIRLARRRRLAAGRRGIVPRASSRAGSLLRASP